MRFNSIDDVRSQLNEQGYILGESIATTVFLSDRLSKPVLVEGPAGTGKTELAKATAQALGARLIRLQCYEGLDESKALYEWDYRKQLLRIQAGISSNQIDDDDQWSRVHGEIFGEEFLLTRPLLEAINAKDPVVLLIDEVDRIEVETEALLLEVLSDYQVSIPELGTVKAKQIPMVFLTSNNTRDLSEALKRRCLFLHIDYPNIETETAIIRRHFPEIDEDFARSIAEAVERIRTLDLQKYPSISETIDWAKALVLWNSSELTRAVTEQSLSLLLKYQADIELAKSKLSSLGL